MEVGAFNDLLSCIPYISKQKWFNLERSRQSRCHWSLIKSSNLHKIIFSQSTEQQNWIKNSFSANLHTILPTVGTGTVYWHNFRFHNECQVRLIIVTLISDMCETTISEIGQQDF